MLAKLAACRPVWCIDERVAPPGVLLCSHARNMAAAVVRVDTNAGETPLFAALQARLGAEHHVVRERLDVGDVVLTAPDGGATLIVERKTWPDLAKSLTDGRYAEQKARLLAAAAAPPPPPCAGTTTAAAGDEDGDEAPLEEEEDEGDALADGGDDGSDVGSGGSTTGVLYLIEGPLKGWSGTVGGAMGGLSKMKNAQLEAALVLTAVRDGVPVLRTKDAAHTVELVVYLLGKLCAGELRLGAGGGGLGGASAHSHADYASLLKKRKRDNMSDETTWRVMLAQPPGMSARKAEAVAAAYPSMAALAAATEAELAAVRVPSAAATAHGGGGGASPSASSSGGGSTTTTAAAGRRLGPAVAKTLAALLR